jgi:hypothetical protein
MDQEDGWLGQIVVVALIAEAIDPCQLGFLCRVLSICVQLVLQKVVVAEAWWRLRDRKKRTLLRLRRVDVIDWFLIGRDPSKLEIYHDATIQQNIRDTQ